MEVRTKKNHELRLGTRASRLALAQAGWIKKQLEAKNPGVMVRLVHIKTSGDKLDVPLFQVGGKGLFVKEIEEALLQGKVDLAVHSAKDLPAVIPEGLDLVAFPEREDPRDVWIPAYGQSWKEIPPGGKVGTGSLRRKAQLLHWRSDLEVVPLRGNLDTRMKKLSSMALDAIVLAAAGLRRLGWANQASEYFDPDVMLPAIGQGALAVETRKEDAVLQKMIQVLDHSPTRLAVKAERAFLQSLGGGCQIPLAGYARLESGRLVLTGLVAALDGGRVIREKIVGTPEQGEELGVTLAQTLLAKGAGEILSEVGG
jgi:hydroxymethylbilane synthase